MGTKQDMFLKGRGQDKIMADDLQATQEFFLDGQVSNCRERKLGIRK